ncbi:hypothetical protein VTO73DRAFT_14346 [Trametes versicolor]
MYSDHAYGYAPHHDEVDALRNQYAPMGRQPPPPSHHTPPSQQGPSYRVETSPTFMVGERGLDTSMHADSSRMTGPSLPEPRRPFLGDPPRYTSASAPSLPTSREELRHIMDVAGNRTTAGLYAVAKLRYWMNERQGSYLDVTDVEKELRNYRVPQWFREEYDVPRTTKDRIRAIRRETGATVQVPSPTDPLEKWLRYINDNAGSHILVRHVGRHPDTGRANENDIRGYIMVNQMSYVETPGLSRDERRRARVEVFRLLAQTLRSHAHYTAELACLGSIVAPTFSPNAYIGPYPFHVDDIVRHAADCGVSPDSLHPAWTGWALHHHGTPSNAGVVQPAAPPDPGPADVETPLALPEGPGAPAAGNDDVTTTPAPPPAPLADAPVVGDGDVTMHESALPPP